MDYVNSQTGVTIKLDGLREEEKKFYRLALKKFHQNSNWLAFDEFAFGMKSPVYSRHRSHLDVLKDPLFLALKDMWLQLGVQQGMVSRTMKAKHRAIA